MAIIDTILPEGQVVNRAWLQKHGIERPMVDYYVRSQKLERVAHGIYRKPGPKLKWQNIVYSLSQLGYSVHLGHESALQFHGYQHYLELGKTTEIQLYSNIKLPNWIKYIEESFVLTEIQHNTFKNQEIGLLQIPFGTWDWPIQYAEPERAFIELASTISSVEEIHHTQLIMESAYNLRPALLQRLLQECKQVKAKRLFLWLAREAAHAWYSHIDQSKLDLGAGKRQIVKNGIFDNEFMITIPRRNADEPTQPLF